MDNRALMSIILFCLSAYTLQTINVISASSNSIMFMGEAVPADVELNESLVKMPAAEEVMPPANQTAVAVDIEEGDRSAWDRFVDWVRGGVDWIASGLVWVGEQITGFFSRIWESMTGGFSAVGNFFNMLWQIFSFDIFVGVPAGTIPTTIEYLIRTLIAVPVNGLAILSISQAVSSVVWGG